MALGGTDANSAIPGFNPGQSADTLYVTNGETTDYAETSAGTIAYTPELGEGVPGAGFVFPDDEALIQAEFERTLDFHLGLARSARASGESGIARRASGSSRSTSTRTRSIRRTDRRRCSTSSSEESYGDPQEVRVLAKRDLGRVTLKYRINGGAVRSARTTPMGRRRPLQPRQLQVLPRDARHGHWHRPGDTVKVWFDGGGEGSDSFTYNAVSESGNRVLVLSAEDYTGASPAQPPGGPFYLSYYTNALTANGVAFDVYDVDAHGRTAPDNLGVLSHYDAVVWYTGDDVVTREPGWDAGNASRLAMQELLEVRDFINEGGRVLYTGQSAGQQYTPGLGTQLYDPFENRQCRADPAVMAGCLACRAPATRKATRSSTGSARRSRRPAAGTTRSRGSCSRSPAWTIRSPV